MLQNENIYVISILYLNGACNDRVIITIPCQVGEEAKDANIRIMQLLEIIFRDPIGWNNR